ncbi:MAG: protein phosphatase 2C domain-containing protein [Myxococcota bacterium]
MRVDSFGRTDIGRRRENNEDAFLRDDEVGFYLVADGVGGNARGEVASAQAVEEALGFVRTGRAAIDAYLRDANEGTHALRRLVESAMQHACYMVFGLGQLDPTRRGMSTTMSSLLLVGRQTPGLGVVGQVGDSRVYLVRDRKIVQLTEDHTLLNFKLKHGLITAEEAPFAPGRNVITRAVGHRDYVQVDTCEIDARPGDVFLLCSDGLHGHLQDPEIVPILEAGPIEEAASRLIDEANARGGRDNITAVVVTIRG